MKMPIISDVMTDIQSARMGGYADGYNDGVKSMEKEFRELLDIANRMVAPSGPKFQAVTDFMFWKKARRIE